MRGPWGSDDQSRVSTFESMTVCSVFQGLRGAAVPGGVAAGHGVDVEVGRGGRRHGAEQETQETAAHAYTLAGGAILSRRVRVASVIRLTNPLGRLEPRRELAYRQALRGPVTARDRSFKGGFMALRTAFPAAWLVLAVGVSGAAAADKVTGKVIVAGKPYSLTQGLAEPDRDDVKVILCDGAAPSGSVKADFDRRDLAKTGKVHCLENTLTGAGKVSGTTVLINAFKMFPSAVATWMLYEPGAKAPGRISGRIHTAKETMSFDDIPYSWDVTF